MIRKSVVAKLWVAIVILMIIILTLLSMGLFQLVENFYYSQIARNLINQGQQIAELYKNAPHNLQVSSQIEMISRIINAHILIVDKEGQIQACNTMMQLPPGSVFQDRELAEVFNGQIAIKRGFHHHFDTQMLSVALPINVDNEIKKAILMYTPVAPITATLASLRRLIYFGLLGSIVLASILAFFLSKNLSKPLIKMNEVAMEMAKGNFNHRIPVSTSDEIGVLSATFNYLSAQLKQNISALSYEKEKLENVLTSMTDGVITLDSAGQIILYNPQAKKLLNDCGEIKEGALLTDCVYLTEVNVLFNEVIKERTIKKGEISPSDKTLSVRLSPLFQPENEEIIGVVVVLQDITKERRLEQMRKEFVANVSHELRTPISLIQGYAEAIMDGLADNPEQRKHFLKIIHDEANRLKRLVDDLLELSRLQTGAIELNKEWVNVEQLCLQLRDKFKSALDQEGLAFRWEICDDATEIWADRFRIEQVLINLMSNAIRYAKKGSIKIDVGKDDQGFLIKVSDTGAGIPARDLPYIFERFYRADKSRNRESGGTGLGLSIVKNIVDAHGGKITVESKEGEGTTFRIFLPGLNI
jgi:two-component system sensor histidine kinase ResE